MAPTLETLLLNFGVAGWRMGRVVFEDAMMLLMTGIVLGVAFGGEFDSNTQTPPPHTQAGQPQRTSRCPGYSIVTTNDFGQAVTMK